MAPPQGSGGSSVFAKPEIPVKRKITRADIEAAPKYRPNPNLPLDLTTVPTDHNLSDDIAGRLIAFTADKGLPLSNLNKYIYVFNRDGNLRLNVNRAPWGPPCLSLDGEYLRSGVTVLWGGYVKGDMGSKEIGWDIGQVARKDYIKWAHTMLYSNDAYSSTVHLEGEDIDPALTQPVPATSLQSKLYAKLGKPEAVDPALAQPVPATSLLSKVYAKLGKPEAVKDTRPDLVATPTPASTKYEKTSSDRVKRRSEPDPELLEPVKRRREHFSPADDGATGHRSKRGKTINENANSPETTFLDGGKELPEDSDDADGELSPLDEQRSGYNRVRELQAENAKLKEDIKIQKQFTKAMEKTIREKKKKAGGGGRDTGAQMVAAIRRVADTLDNILDVMRFSANIPPLTPDQPDDEGETFSEDSDSDDDGSD